MRIMWLGGESPVNQSARNMTAERWIVIGV